LKNRLRISVSGIRGKVPEALNVEIASKFASAFSSYLEKGRMAVCRDCRKSSQMLAMASISSIMASGMDCIDYGRLPTPFLQFLLKEKNFAGGISVSAGHNPSPWNAILLLNKEGLYLESSEGPEVFNIYEAGSFKKSSWNKLGKMKESLFPFDLYLEALSKIIDLREIRKAGFKITADPCNGAVSPYLKSYSDFFELKIISINDETNKSFSHSPEPSIENSSQAEAVVKATNSDLGFLLNSDGSRISLVSNKGIGLSEEMTFPLCLISLKKNVKVAVSTVATSSFIDWVGNESNIKIIKTKVGQSSVTHTMLAEGAELGGEGSGSCTFFPFSPGYDSLLALTLILDLMARERKSLSEIISPFPDLIQRKIKIQVSPVKIYRVMDQLEEKYAKERPDYTDGIRVNRKKSWFIIRPSLTEFILRIMIEGRDLKSIDSIEEEIKERIES
jgi:phosphomannomutase